MRHLKNELLLTLSIVDKVKINNSLCQLLTKTKTIFILMQSKIQIIYLNKGVLFCINKLHFFYIFKYIIKLGNMQTSKYVHL